jgi:hypothetical protein
MIAISLLDSTGRVRSIWPLNLGIQEKVLPVATTDMPLHGMISTYAKTSPGSLLRRGGIRCR